MNARAQMTPRSMEGACVYPATPCRRPPSSVVRPPSSAYRPLSTVHCPPSTAAGFTIIELLVSATITVILAGIMISITSTMTSTAQRASGSLLSSNQAKVALDYLAQDLQSAVMRRDGNVWLAATVQPDQTLEGDSNLDSGDWSTGDEKPGAAESLRLWPTDSSGDPTYRFEEYRFGMAGVWLRLFTVEPDSNSGLGNTSTVRAVAYQIVRFKVGGLGSLRYGLFRSTVAPDDSFAAGFNLFYDAGGTTPSAYNDPDGGQQVAGNVRQPRADYLLANNVVDFGVRFWQRQSGGDLLLLFPNSASNCGFAACVAATVPPRPDPWEPVAGASLSFGFPDVADVFVRVLTDDGAKQIEALERGQITGTTWWDLALANSTVYTRRVEMKARPL